MTQAAAIQHIDNDHVRVTEWRFGPGDATGWHRHGYDYVITPVVGGTVELVGPDGTRSRAEMVPGQSYFRAAGVEHDVINAGDGPLIFVETELKHRQG
ncbi:MAG: cupin domain-containing protein [Pseudomonadota bacterium]